ncbi:MAG: MauE/DoxX family redox-associated membrane protein [Solirubrobacterales bacterium]
MDSFIIGVQLLLAGLFAFAGVAKLFDLKGSRQAMSDFGVPERMAPAAAVVIPLLEIGTAVALVLAPSARWGGVAALTLLLVFCAGIANAMAHGKDVDCGCFGRVYSAVAGSRTLARNAVLAILAAILVIRGPGPSIGDWVSERSAAELVAIAVTVAAVALAAFSVWIWRKNKKLEREAAVRTVTEFPEPEEFPKGEPEGLPVGSVAPDFSLPDSQGGTHTLADLRARGLPVVLEFIDPGCASCIPLLANLERWQATLADKVTVALVTNGGPEDPVWAEEAPGLTNTLFDEPDQISKDYNVRGTPSAIAIGTDGTVLSAPAGGMHMPEVLIRRLINGGAVEGGSPSKASAGAAAEPRSA